MSTNLLDLAQLPALRFTIASGADWDDQIFQAQPGFSATPATTTATLSSSSATLSSVGSLAGVYPGGQIGGPGIAPGTTVVSASGSSVVASAAPTLNAAGVGLTFFPPPLDLTGIAFAAKIRATPQSPGILLQLSTAAGTMINGGTSGIYGFAVPAATIQAVQWPLLDADGSANCVMDIVASDASGATVNLCALNGPLTVAVALQVTR